MNKLIPCNLTLRPKDCGNISRLRPPTAKPIKAYPTKARKGLRASRSRNGSARLRNPNSTSNSPKICKINSKTIWNMNSKIISTLSKSPITKRHPTPELTRREHTAFSTIGEDNDKSHALERSGSMSCWRRRAHFNCGDVVFEWIAKPQHTNQVSEQSASRSQSDR